MRRLLPILCLTLAVLLGSAGEGWSADFEKGFAAAKRGDFATALREFKPLAEQGHADALWFLGIMYRNGQGVPQDYKTAVKWLGLAANQGYPFASDKVEELQQKIAEQTPSPKVTADKPKPKVDQQKRLDLARRTQKALQVLRLYSGKLDGIIGAKTRSAIQRWQKRNGYPGTGEVTEAQLERLEQEAITRLAEEKSEPKVAKNKPSPTVIPKKTPTAFSVDFQKGRNAYVHKKDFATALRHFKPLAEQGHAVAQSILGEMFQHGKGVAQNYKTAEKWYRLAAEQGNVGAQENLVLLTKEVARQKREKREKAEWIAREKREKAIREQGDAEAQFNLGMVYQHGNGVPQDSKTAVKWHTLAAEQGHAGAQVNLGQMYYNGDGVTLNYKTALKWYGLAAEKGNAGAQYMLGEMYYREIGVPQDFENALKWYRLAAEQGDARAQTGVGIVKEIVAREKREKADRMEMQFFILGHIILYAICMAGCVASADRKTGRSYLGAPFIALLFFIPLEIIYWMLDFVFGW